MKPLKVKCTQPRITKNKCRFNHKYTYADRLRMVKMRYGTTELPLPNPIKPISAIVKLLRTNRTVVKDSIRKFKAGSLIDGRTLNSGRRIAGLTPEIKEVILSNELLDQWKRYSIKTRVRVIRERFAVEFSPSALELLYKSHGVTWRKIEFAMNVTKIKKKQEIARGRALFVRRILTISANEELPMIHWDESTFNISGLALSNKCW